jgi:hypothetical protein
MSANAEPGKHLETLRDGRVVISAASGSTITTTPHSAAGQRVRRSTLKY